MPEALPELVWFALLLFCFAFVWAARKLIAGMFKPIIDGINAAHVPYVSAAISGALGAVEQAISDALGSVEHGIDQLMGSSWHRLAELNMWLWREFTAHTTIGWLTAQIVSEVVHAYHYLRGQVHDLTHSHTATSARVKSLEKEYRGIEHKVKQLERDLSHGIGNDVLPRLKALEREAGRIENVELPAAVAAQDQAQSAIDNLYAWAKGKAALVGVGTFALAVSAALDAIGLSGLKCPSFLNSLKNRGCGLWNGLEDMLGLFVDVALIASICDVLPWLTKGVDDVGLGLVEAIHSSGLSLCSGTYPPPPPMPSLKPMDPKVYGTTLAGS